MTRFSVVVPAYNAEDTLAETLDAALAQTFSDWECIVVDDGSKDGTLELARSYERDDARFRVLTQDNRGTGGAYNTGVGAAVGEWISICSADDVLLPTLLERMALAIDDNPDYGIFSCNGYFWWPDGSRGLVYRGDQSLIEHSWTLEEVLERCFFSVGSCYRAQIFKDIGGYLEDAYGEDYDFWLRAMTRGSKHLYIPEALSLHRKTDTQKSANLTKAFESDIRSITGVLSSGFLSASQTRAARKAIRQRKLLIAAEAAPGSFWVRVRMKFWELLGKMGIA